EANRYYDEYIEGVGAFWDYYVGSAHKGTKTYLVAAHKVNGKSCGSIGPFPTGLNEAIKNAFFVKFYPNPVVGTLQLKLDAAKASQGYKIEMKNVFGSVVYKSDGELSLSETEFDFTNLPRGIYFFEIWQEGQLRVVRKITKQ
ncbi:MAG: T9SS type A sorting domain-containing protein, partial [Bacteroidia bacterium]|nr:T9SS type A sorting domain-containing protein [Bacteroidia bacterium]